FRLEWWNHAEHFDLFIANRVAVQGRGGLHSQERHDLQHVVLDDIANSAGGVVKLAPPFNAETFRHRDLDTLDVVSIPDRFEEGMGKPEEQQVQNGFLAEIVINSKDSGLW